MTWEAVDLSALKPDYAHGLAERRGGILRITMAHLAREDAIAKAEHLNGLIKPSIVTECQSQQKD